MRSPATRPLSDADLAVLASGTLFRSLEADALASVARAARKVSLSKKQPLFLQGEKADAVFFLLTGRAKVLETGEDGNQVMLRLESPGALLGLLAALGGEPAYPVSAEALEPVTAARWEGPELAGLLQAHPVLALKILPMVLGRLRESQDQVRALATEKVERRVARAVVRLVRQAGRATPEGVKVDVALTRQELAEMAGTTLFTVSRLLSQWSADGVLESKGKRLLITQPHALMRLAEDFDGAG